MYRGSGFDHSILYSALMPTCMEGVPLLFSFPFAVYISVVPGLCYYFPNVANKLSETYPATFVIQIILSIVAW